MDEPRKPKNMLFSKKELGILEDIRGFLQGSLSKNPAFRSMLEEELPSEEEVLSGARISIPDTQIFRLGLVHLRRTLLGNNDAEIIELLINLVEIRNDARPGPKPGSKRKSV